MNSRQLLDSLQKELGITSLDYKKILTTLLSRGGELSELFFERSSQTRVIYENQKIDQVVEGRDQGVGLRLIAEQKVYYAYTTELTEEALLKAADSLAQSVASGKAKPVQIPTTWSPEQKIKELSDYQIQNDPRKMPLTEKVKVVERVDAGARAELPEAKQIKAIFLDTERKILVVNSDGLMSPDHKTLTTVICEVVAEKNGVVESAYEVHSAFAGTEFFNEESPEETGRNAAKKVKTLLSAKNAPAGKMPVVIHSEAGGTMIHEAVGHGLEADLACNHLSVYDGKLGKQVASPKITVVDDGTMSARRGTYRFDDEGNPSQKTTLIENGVLKSYMVDRLSAMKFDMMATGNGRRESFRHKPIVRMTNTYIAPGSDDPDSILKDTKWGLFVKGMGGGQVNTVTGDFVFAVTEGYIIRDGKLGEAVRGATLVGNGPEVLMQVDKVGSDLGFATGTCGKDGQGAPVTDAQPTMRINGLTVGGEAKLEEVFPLHAPKG